MFAIRPEEQTHTWRSTQASVLGYNSEADEMKQWREIEERKKERKRELKWKNKKLMFSIQASCVVFRLI